MLGENPPLYQKLHMAGFEQGFQGGKLMNVIILQYLCRNGIESGNSYDDDDNNNNVTHMPNAKQRFDNHLLAETDSGLKIRC
jgi:hypothetical protein